MNKQQIEVFRRLVEYFEESHADEIRTRHHGDGRKGCTYCDAIRDAKKELKKAEAKK